MRYFLVTTEHLENKVWFRDFDDFSTAMNLVAVVSITLRVNVLAFILMSNHVHFVLECDRWKAEMFTNELKKQYSRYFRLKYGAKELLRGNKNDIQEVSMEQESLERAIAYVLMNCVAANICANPFSYIWGTGGTYFRGSPAEGKRLDSFSGRRQARLLHSKAKRRLLSMDADIPSFRDQVIVMALPDLCKSLFGTETLIGLDQEQFKELFRQLRYRFSSNVEQMARISGIPIESVIRYLDRL